MESLGGRILEFFLACLFVVFCRVFWTKLVFQRGAFCGEVVVDCVVNVVC